METLSNWDGEWSISHPHDLAEQSLLVGPTTMTAWPTSSCFDVVYGGGVAAAQQQLMNSQLPTNPVDQLLLLGGLAGSDSDLSGQSFDYGLMGRPSLDRYLSSTNTAHTSPALTDSGSSLPFWTVPNSSSETRFDHNNLHYPQQLAPQATVSVKKRKRVWNPDPDPDQEKFTIIGSGSGYEYPPTSNGLFKLIRETKSLEEATATTTTTSLSTTPAAAHNISFQNQGSAVGNEEGDVDAEAIQQMKEMIYRAAALRPVNLGEEVAVKPRRKNVKISSDPQTVAARQRRERISERLRLLQKLVPGGCKMDTASMLDEAANYLKFLRSQIKALQAMPASSNRMLPGVNSFNLANFGMLGYDDHLATAAIPTMHLAEATHPNNHLLLPHHNPTGLIHH